MDRRKVILVLASLILISGIIGLIGLLVTKNPTKKPRVELPQAAVSVAQQYIQAREDRIGADQTSATAWLDVIKPIVTSDWLGKLQPISNPSTGATPYSFVIAHNNGYKVIATVSNCAWDDILLKPSETKGLIMCNLRNRTVDANTNNEIAANRLPFGWTYTGVQPAAQLILVKQNGLWLVDSDVSGQGR